MVEVPCFVITFPSPFRISLGIMAWTSIAEKAGAAAGRKCLPKGETWDATEVPSPDIIRLAASIRPSWMEGKTARMENIFCGAASGLSEVATGGS